MKIEEIGERGLIERICKNFFSNSEAIIEGAGEDDAAIVDVDMKAENNLCLVITTDMLQQSTHFPEGISPFQIGWTIVAVNLSDFAAMGVRPFALTIAMGIPEDTEVAFVEEIIRGIKECASLYNTYIVGGDTVKSRELVFAGTCFGFASKDKILSRRGAKVGDNVCVTNSLGWAALAMNIIKEGKKVTKEVEKKAKKRLFQPEPRINESFFLASTGMVTSMIDISDGLALSLMEIGERSVVGFEIYEDKVPVDEEIKSLEVSGASALDLRSLAFYYGGDYELLFTMDPKALENKDMMKRLEKGIKMSIIGKVVPQADGIYFKKGKRKENIKIKGYQHF